MKNLLRKLFSPVLKPLESGDEPFAYKPLNRKILLVASALFTIIVGAVIGLMPENVDKGYYLPVFVFGSLAIIGFVVGTLGSDRAVAKLWGGR